MTFRKNKYLICLILLTMVLFLSGCDTKNNNIPKASKGKIDLTKWDFERDGIINLDGQWELYWGQLLEPSYFHKNDNIEAKDFLKLPNSLSTTVNNAKLPKFGYGTMRIKVELKPDKDKLYGIEIQHVLSASKVWINGQLVTSTGRVGTNEKNAIGSFEHNIAYFKNDSKEVEIVIQMSNYNNDIWKIQGIQVGDSGQLKRYFSKKVAIDMFIAGSLFIMGMYHFTLYYKRRKEKSTLYFGVFCLIIALRNTLVSSRVIYEFLPNIQMEFFNKLAYLTFYFALPFYIMFFKELFTKEISKNIVNAVKILATLLTIITIITPVQVYENFLEGYELLTVIVCVYILFIIIKATIKKMQGALIILFGFSFLLTTIIHDICIQSGIIYGSSILPIGFFLFIFSQSYMLAAKFSNAFSYIENLLEENKELYIDQLTGILNRRGFYEQGEMLYKNATITGVKFIIFFADLNKLKVINDSFGHNAGDEAICTAARVLKTSFGMEDVVARVSGDEFIAIAVNQETELEAKASIDLVNSNFNEYNLASNKSYKISISIGYSIFLPGETSSLDELIHEADNMLYYEKKKRIK